MNVAIAVLLVSAHLSQAAPGLSLDVAVQSPASMVDVGRLALRATVRNTGDIPLKLLNDHGSILSKARTNVFKISSKTCTPEFTGFYVNYDPSLAAKSAEPAMFTALAPGQDIKIDYPLGDTYNFTQCGGGSYNLIPSKDFLYVDGSGELKAIKALAKSTRFVLTGNSTTPSDRTRTSTVSKRDISFTGCSPTQQRRIRAATIAMDHMLTGVISYLAGLNPNTRLAMAGFDPNQVGPDTDLTALGFSTPRYTTWFGTMTKSRYQTIMGIFNGIKSQAPQFKYDCTACFANPDFVYELTYGYIYRQIPNMIFLCGTFWSAPIIGMNAKPGMLIHEMSHSYYTVDLAYGRRWTQALINNDPSLGILNADSYRLFAENIPVLD